MTSGNPVLPAMSHLQLHDNDDNDDDDDDDDDGEDAEEKMRLEDEEGGVGVCLVAASLYRVANALRFF